MMTLRWLVVPFIFPLLILGALFVAALGILDRQPMARLCSTLLMILLIGGILQ